MTHPYLEHSDTQNRKSYCNQMDSVVRDEVMAQLAVDPAHNQFLAII